MTTAREQVGANAGPGSRLFEIPGPPRPSGLFVAAPLPTDNELARNWEPAW